VLDTSSTASARLAQTWRNDMTDLLSTRCAAAGALRRRG
jgi:hypothetical protein